MRKAEGEFLGTLVQDTFNLFEAEDDFLIILEVYSFASVGSVFM